MTDSSETSLPRSDGLFVREWLPRGTARGAFLLLHGMESHSGWFEDAAARLNAAGWAVLAGDRRGWGRSPGERGRLDSYRDFVEETAALAVGARERFATVHLAGMSWGGMAALYMGLRRGWLFDSLALLAPGLHSRRDLRSMDKLRVAESFMRDSPERLVTPLFRPEDFTRDPERRRFITADPLRLHRVGASFCRETLKMRRFIAESAGRRRLPPALCLLAGDDAIIDNRRTEESCRRAGIATTTLAGAAHTLVFERPEEIATLLSRHAAGAAAARERDRRRVWIVGGGAVGGAAAALLSFAGHETGLLVKPGQAEAMRRDGIFLETGRARRRAGETLTVAGTPEGLPADPELVVLAVKSFDTPAALAALRDALPPRAVLASLQNGIGNEAVMAAAFPDRTLAAAAICAGLEMPGPGVARWADDRGGVGAACLQGDAERAREVWLGAFSATGLETMWVDGPRAALRLKWSKLMLNIGFNALNAVTGLSAAAVLRHPEYGGLAVRAMREGFAAMRALSLEPVDFPGFPVAKLRLLLRLPLAVARRLLAWQAGRAPETPFSMRQDVLKKRQHTEITELNGVIVRFGGELGTPTAANEIIVKMTTDFHNAT